MRMQGTPPPPDVGDSSVWDRSSADDRWREGQDVAAALDLRIEAAQHEAERERLGDLADALRGL